MQEEQFSSHHRQDKWACLATPPTQLQNSLSGDSQSPFKWRYLMNLLVQYNELDSPSYSDILFKRKLTLLVHYERYFIVNWKIRLPYDPLLHQTLLLQVKPYNIYVTMAFPPDTDTPGLAEENKSKVGTLLSISFFFPQIQRANIGFATFQGFK